MAATFPELDELDIAYAQYYDLWIDQRARIDSTLLTVGWRLLSIGDAIPTNGARLATNGEWIPVSVGVKEVSYAFGPHAAPLPPVEALKCLMAKSLPGPSYTHYSVDELTALAGRLHRIGWRLLEPGVDTFQYGDYLCSLFSGLWGEYKSDARSAVKRDSPLTVRRVEAAPQCAPPPAASALEPDDLEHYKQMWFFFDVDPLGLFKGK